MPSDYGDGVILLPTVSQVVFVHVPLQPRYRTCRYQQCDWVRRKRQGGISCLPYCCVEQAGSAFLGSVRPSLGIRRSLSKVGNIDGGENDDEYWSLVLAKGAWSRSTHS